MEIAKLRYIVREWGGGSESVICRLLQQSTVRRALPSPGTERDMDLTLCTGGKGSVAVGAHEHDIEAGSLMIYPGASQITLSGVVTIRHLRIHLTSKHSSSIDIPRISYSSKHTGELLHYFDKLDSLLELDFWPLENKLRLSLAHSLIGCIYEEIKHPPKNQHHLNAILRVCREINENPIRRYSLKELADLVQLSPYHFSRIFKKEMSKSPTDYLIRKRCEHIEAAIFEQQLSVEEAANFGGYPDLFSFSKQFKKIMGVSPSQLLKRGR
jgi:AraC-like DNA-binding protein